MKAICAAVCAVLAAAPAFAGTVMSDGKDSKKTMMEPCPPDTRVLFNITSSYVFESDFEQGKNNSGDAWQNNVQFGYRIPLGEGWPREECGMWHLRLGAEYSRFDFSNEGGLPIPNHLQGAAGVIALEYLVRGQIALLIETHPGVFFENDIDSDSFDAPTVIGGTYRFSDSFIGVVGATFASMREYPIIPGVGFIWLVNDRLTVSAVYPSPRVTYKATDALGIYAGGEFVGGSFRVDDAKGRPGKLDNAVVSYSEYRAGVGLTYQSGPVSFEVAGGYAFEREFDFHRAEKAYRTDEGAAYVKVELKTAF